MHSISCRVFIYFQKKNTTRSSVSVLSLMSLLASHTLHYLFNCFVSLLSCLHQDQCNHSISCYTHVPLRSIEAFSLLLALLSILAAFVYLNVTYWQSFAGQVSLLMLFTCLTLVGVQHCYCLMPYAIAIPLLMFKCRKHQLFSCHITADILSTIDAGL